MPTLRTGDAKGADSCFINLALESNHRVEVCIAHNHRVPNISGVYIDRLVDVQKAQTLVNRANESLHRSIRGLSPYALGYILRDTYQIQGTDAVYAVGYFEQQINPGPWTVQVKGGTAWAVQSYVDSCRNEPQKLELLFFDQNQRKWFKGYLDNQGFRWLSVWEPSNKVVNVYTGIGSRDLTPEGIQAIRSLYV